MRPQSPSPTYLHSALSAATTLRGSVGDGSRDGPPPGVCGDGATGRQAHRHLTSARALRVYNLPAASGQRPAASGQRPAASGQRPAAMTCARRQAGARKPAPSTSAGSQRPDARTGRARARRLSLLLPVLALLAGMLSLFAAAPAEAQTTLLTATLTVDVDGTTLVFCHIKILG